MGWRILEVLGAAGWVVVGIAFGMAIGSVTAEYIAIPILRMVLN